MMAWKRGSSSIMYSAMVFILFNIINIDGRPPYAEWKRQSEGSGTTSTTSAEGLDTGETIGIVVGILTLIVTVAGIIVSLKCFKRQCKNCWIQCWIQCCHCKSRNPNGRGNHKERSELRVMPDSDTPQVMTGAQNLNIEGMAENLKSQTTATETQLHTDSTVREKRLRIVSPGSVIPGEPSGTNSTTSGQGPPDASNYVDHACLVKDLDEVAYEWNGLGIQLNVKNLKNISSGFSSQKCFRDVVLHWLKNPTPTKPTKRKVLEKALEAVGNRRLAMELSSKFNIPEGLPRLFAFTMIHGSTPEDWPKIKTGKIWEHLSYLSSAAVSGSEPQANLLNVLKPVTPHYQSFGIQLGISLDKIKEFERNSAGRRTVQDCFEEMLGLWLRGGNCKLDTLVKGLEQIDQRRLAGCLKERYRGKTLVFQIPEAAP